MTRSATNGTVTDAVDGHRTKHPQPVLNSLLSSDHDTYSPPQSTHQRPKSIHHISNGHDNDGDSDSDVDVGLVMRKKDAPLQRVRPSLVRAQSEATPDRTRTTDDMQPLDEESDVRMRHGWEAQLESPEQAHELSQNFFMYFEDKRHETAGNPALDFDPKHIVSEWRMRDRLRTVAAVLAICLNVGVDPPDVIKTNPCARLECWVDPVPPDSSSQSSSNTNAQIGKNLQTNYEAMSIRTRYKAILDPTIEDLRKYTTSMRRTAHAERILFHYNGHGVPKSTASGEVWCFNRSYTQYIPISLYDLQEWVGAPGLWVWDCSASGSIIPAFLDAAAKHSAAQQEALKRDPAKFQQQPLIKWEDCIHLAACRENEVLPTNPELPADIFTSCLTTPIPMAVRFFILQNPLRSTFGVTLEQARNIPGKVSERRTPLGELNWIFTAITDTIAWNCLPKPLFKKLFRQDLMVAALFRNLLLAQRVMRMYHCHPLSHPPVPDTHDHPLWQSWDLALEMILAQLPDMLAQQKANEALMESQAGSATPMPPLDLVYNHSDFFADQLSAFEVYLTSAPANVGASGYGKPPAQLPIVLQVLLSQVHRLRALILLSKFLDLGPWAVELALSIGIFPYVLRLLQSQAVELKPPMIFIWARILAVDQSCQADLLKDQGYMYFTNILDSATGIPLGNVADHRAMCAFIVAMFCKDFRLGKLAVMETNPNIIDSCLSHILDMENPLLRQFSCLCLSSLWKDFPQAKSIAMAYQAQARICDRSHDPVPEVRAACLDALTSFISTGEVDPALVHEDETLASVVVSMGMDGSIMVRKELVVFYSTFIKKYENKFLVAAWEQLVEERDKRTGRPEESDAETPVNDDVSTEHHGRNGSIVEEFRNGHGRSVSVTTQTSDATSTDIQPRLHPTRILTKRTIYRAIWRQILSMSTDPHPEVAQNAQIVVDHIFNALLGSPLGEFAYRLLDEFLVRNLKKDHTTLQALEGLHRQRSREVPPDTPPSPAPSAAGRGDSYFSGLTRNSSIAVGLKNLIGGWGQRTPVSENPPALAPRSYKSPMPSELPHRPRAASTGENEQLPPDALDNIAGPAHQPPAKVPSSPFCAPRDLTALPEIPLKSKFFHWSGSYFREPQMRPSEADEPGSLDYNERLWRRNRNDKIIKRTQPLKDAAGSQSWDTPCGHFGIGAAPFKMVFHQFENHLVTADDRDSIAVWDWKAREQLARFSNGNPVGSRVTELRFINEDDQAMLMTGSSDGVIKIFRDYDQPRKIQLASSFRALSDLVVSDKQNAGLVFDWQQGQGRVLVAGDDRVIRVWQVGHELCISDIPARSGSCITSLTSDQVEGNIFVAGFGNGAVRAYDQRLPARESMVMDWVDRTRHHKSWIVGCHLQRGGLRELISAESSGGVRLWDLRNKNAVASFDHRRPREPRSLRTLSVHEHAPVFATGGADHRIRVFNTSLQRLSNFEPAQVSALPFARGPKVAPITATAFHPHRMMLACGASNDGHVSLFKCDAVVEEKTGVVDDWRER